MASVPGTTAPRGMYALAMGVTGVVAVVLAGLLSSSFGGASQSIHVLLPVLGIAVVGAAVGLLPVFFPDATRFGLVVMAVSVGRLFFVLTSAMVLSEVLGKPARPVWIPLAVAGGLMLVVETLLAVSILKNFEDTKTAAEDQHAVEVLEESVSQQTGHTQESCSPC